MNKLNRRHIRNVVASALSLASRQNEIFKGGRI
jgi:hypothetical protein